NPDFDEIPAGFAKLKNLQYLEIRNCPLKSIAPELGDCAELAGLVLVDVRPLASLPDGLGKLEKLNYVEISSTNIEKLPATISNWKSVEELNVSGNNLVELPEEIGGMESLQVLRTYGNYAMYVPAGLAKLSKLESYDHGDIDYRDISEADLKAGLPNLVFRQVTSQDRIRPTAS
ncbi:MAG TPA: leucine-rich repeat domain-containing protein, partial [Bacteroidetes bacterium]|nr:leucine-rich repeat domain-containing protein [Bacteroidota bacterium]